MIRYFCDRCDVQVSGPGNLHNISVEQKEADLRKAVCGDCRREIAQFVRQRSIDWKQSPAQDQQVSEL